MLRSPARCRRAVSALSAACLLVPLAACTGSSEALDVDGFAPGACSDIASTLQEVDATRQEVADEDATPEEAGQRFRDAQAPLKEAVASAQGPVEASITELVTRLGFFRIAVDSNSYDGSQLEDVGTALDDLAQECRGG